MIVGEAATNHRDIKSCLDSSSSN